MSAERRQFRVLVAPHRVPLEGRRKRQNAVSDLARSFVATREQSARIHPARWLATAPGAASIRATLSPKFCFMNSVILDFSSSGEGNGGGGGGGFCAM